jgi:Zn-dependent protease
MDIENAFLNVSLLWILTTPHEFAHAWVAEKLGDDTPRREGRVTLHPMAHLDWMGTLILPAITSLMGMGFLGWGKPVNTNPSRLRGGLQGLAVVALAGPASNVVFAAILAVLSVATANLIPVFAEYCSKGVTLSLYLALFNMLPVPPLDGSKLLLAAGVPAAVYQELANFGFLLMIIALSSTGLGGLISLWSWKGTEGLFRLLQ